MSKHTFFPYHARQEAITLRIEPQNPDAVTVIDGYMTCLDSQVAELELDVIAEISPEVLAEVLSPEELMQPPVQVSLVLHSLESRQRLARRMIGRSGEYRTVLTLNRRDWRGTIQFQVYLLRSTTNPALPVDYGSDRGAILASSVPMTLLLDEPPVPPAGSVLQPRWDNFAASSNPFLKAQPESLYAVDMQLDPPILYLNSGLMGATDTLQSNATHGRAARIRDLTFNMISSQVTTSMLSTALMALAVVAQAQVGGNDDSPLAELGGWQQALIREWTPRLYPELGRRAAIQQVQDEVRSVGWQSDLLLRRLPRAIQEEFKTGHEFTKAATEVWS